MNLTSKKTIKDLLVRYQLNPSKGLGQNFLIDPHAIQEMLTAAQIEPTDTILEIGPGLGALTQALAQKARKVIAIEKDQKMVNILQETLKDFKNVEIIYGDVLKLDTAYLMRKTDYKIVASLPYYITAPVIRKFLEMVEARPRTMVLVVQKEVAQRIRAKPLKMNILALSVQFYAVPKIIAYVKKTSFWPQPKVDAAILQILPLSTAYPVDPHKFFTVVKAGFSQPRKQLLNNLSTQLHLPRKQVEQWLQKNNIQPTQRAETLTIQNWIDLANTL